MTDAFQCDGCGEYHHQLHRLVAVELDIKDIAAMDITLDELPTEAYELADADISQMGGGDYCTECGMQLLQTLVGLFGGDGDE